MTLILQVIYSVFSGLLLTLGIPNEIFLLGNPFYAFISIIPYYLAIKNSKSYGNAYLMGFIQAITTHLASSFWLAYFKDFAIFTLGASAFGTACIGGSLAIFMYVPFSRQERSNLSLLSINKPFYEDSAFRILYFTVLYTLYEWAKSTGFIGYPWGTISSAMYRWHSFTQLAAITGTYGITFLTVLFDCIIAEGSDALYLSLRYQGSDTHLEERKPYFQSILNAAAVFSILFLITLLWGNYEYNRPRTPDKVISTVMVQQNSDPWLSDTDDITLEASMKLSQKRIDELRKLGKEPQLIVWSEGALQSSFPNAYNHYRWYPEDESLIDFIRRNEVPLLTGGVYRKNIPIPKKQKAKTGPQKIKKQEEKEDAKPDTRTRFYNSAIMFDKNGKFRGYYGKLHLVPFAESIPGIDNPIINYLFQKIVGFSAGWTPGEQLAYFEVPCSWYGQPVIPRVNNINIAVPFDTIEDIKDTPLVRIAAPVCFDDSFTDVIRPMFQNGAELFVNLTDDSWSLKKSSEYQHFCIASYRAIEYRTTLVRSTNAGYSVVVSPSGDILADQPLFEESSLAYDVPVYKRVITPYARFGNWLPYTCFVIFVIVCILMVCNFVTDDYIPSERKHQILLKKHKKNKKHKK